MSLKQIIIYSLVFLLIVGAYFAIYHGMHVGDIVYRQALKEADGDEYEALKRLGPTYVDQDGHIVRVSIERSIERKGRARTMPHYMLGNRILKKLSKVDTITHLSIGYRTKIDGGGMKYVARMKNLKVLSLKFNALTADELDQLVEMDNLKIIYVKDDYLSEDDIESFEKRSSGCTVYRWPTDAKKAPEIRSEDQGQFIDSIKNGELELIDHRQN